MPSTLSRPQLFVACLGLSCLVGATFAQPRPDGRGRFGNGGRPAFGGGPLELLQRPEVQAEVELLDEQKKELQTLVIKSNERRREALSGFADQFRNRDAASEADRAALRGKVQELFQTLNAETERGLSFLLPHQRTRLAQLEVQFRMRGGGFGTLTSPEIGKRLALTDEQRELLEMKATELGREFSQKLAELRREMQEKLLTELTPEQRTNLREMIGDPFEFRDRPPGGVDRGPPDDDRS